MRRALLPWIVALLIAALAGTGAVVVLNATVFGPGAFVRVYLDALARGDVSNAMTLPGVTANGEDELLLRDGTLGALSGIHQISDQETGGVHDVSVGWTTAHGRGTTDFEVERVGTRFGLFPEWGFAVSPVATVSLSVRNDSRFTVNGVQEVSSSLSNAAVDYAVLIPGSYTFGHSSALLTAAPQTVVADTVGQKLSALVQPLADSSFISKVNTQVRSQLAACVQQTVLFPTGCSFGQSVQNRVSGAPAWTIVHYPDIRIVPGDGFGSWAIPGTAGTAHLKVAVTSLLDGSVSSFDQDVPFRLQATITLGAGDAITVVQK